MKEGRIGEEEGGIKIKKGSSSRLKSGGANILCIKSHVPYFKEWVN